MRKIFKQTFIFNFLEKTMNNDRQPELL